jgi:SAM-dependent methyltransferase
VVSRQVKTSSRSASVPVARSASLPNAAPRSSVSTSRKAMLELGTRRNTELVRTGTLQLQPTDGVAHPFDDDSVDAALSVHNVYFWPEPQMTIAEIARVLRPGGRALLAFRSSEHALPRRLDPAVYRDVTTNQCVDWLTGAGLAEALSHHPDDVAARFPLCTRPGRRLRFDPAHLPRRGRLQRARGGRPRLAARHHATTLKPTSFKVARRVRQPMATAGADG